jgi:hypothetical protein
LLVSPSSRASSWTRMFDGNCYLSLLDIVVRPSAPAMCSRL